MTLAGLLIAVPGYSATVSQAWGMVVADPPPVLQLAESLREEQGEVLTDQPDLAVLTHQPLQFEFVIFTILAAQHVWDEQPILDAIAAHRFGLVVLTQPLDTPEQPLIGARWSPAVQQALRANYDFVEQRAGYWLYRPRAE
jgi:hypothetical protein